MTNKGIFDPSAWSALEIGFPVDDMEAIKRFYCDGLGFEPAGHVDLDAAHIEAFRFGNCLLKLSLFRDVARRPKPRQPDPSPCYLTLRVASLDQAVSRCLDMGISLRIPVGSFQTKALRTGRFAFVCDPMGNLVELVEGSAWSD